MLIEISLAAGLGATFVQAWKASDLNEKALNSLKKAYNTRADAVALYEQHKADADQKLIKLVNRKKAILNNRMDQFLSVYEKIREIDFRPGEGILELYSNNLSVRQVEEIKTMAMTAKRSLTEKEMAVQYLFTGIGGLMLADSKRNVEIANSQKRIANTLYSQVETMVIAIDAIGARAEQISELLSQFGRIFATSIQATSEVIETNGTDRQRYTKADREILMNCVNVAGAVKAILDVPILNADGSVTEASLMAIQEGKSRLQDIQYKMGS